VVKSKVENDLTAEPPEMSSDEMRQMPAPWTAEKTEAGYKIADADGKALAWTYTGDLRSRPSALNDEEARRLAATIVRLPELLAKERRIAAVRADLESRADALMEWPEDAQAAALELIANVVDAIDGPKI
jgi:hypothetical protein